MTDRLQRRAELTRDLQTKAAAINRIIELEDEVARLNEPRGEWRLAAVVHATDRVWVVTDWSDHNESAVDSVWSTKEAAELRAESLPSSSVGVVSEHVIDGASDSDG